MSFEQKNKNWLTPLLRWISGEATRHDEQSLDGLAKDDPFLADALDGYHSQADGSHAETVTRLKANLRRRTRKQRGAGFYVLRVAAIGAVLVAAWFVFRQFDQGEMTQTEMAEQATQEREEPAVQIAPSVTQSEPENIAEAATDTAALQTFSKQKNKTLGIEADQLAFSDDKKPALKYGPAEAQAPKVFKEEKIVIADSSPVVAETDVAISPKKETPEVQVQALENAKAGQDAAAKRKSSDRAMPPAAPLNAPGQAPSQARTITGTITDESGEPLIGANVLAKGTTAGAITDVEGHYSINVPEGTSTLQIAYVGYTTLEVTLDGENRLDVQLTESGEALSEVVVTSMGRGRKVISPKPKGGFKKFEKYLRENMRRPDSAAATQVSGIVTVQFRILKNGKLADFQPASSLGQAFRDEAVRLLREGPEWRGEPGTFTTYAIRF
jgi:hypothetical protein